MKLWELEEETDTGEMPPPQKPPQTLPQMDAVARLRRQNTEIIKSNARLAMHVKRLETLHARTLADKLAAETRAGAARAENSRLRALVPSAVAAAKTSGATIETVNNGRLVASHDREFGESDAVNNLHKGIVNNNGVQTATPPSLTPVTSRSPVRDNNEQRYAKSQAGTSGKPHSSAASQEQEEINGPIASVHTPAVGFQRVRPVLNETASHYATPPSSSPPRMAHPSDTTLNGKINEDPIQEISDAVNDDDHNDMDFGFMEDNMGDDFFVDAEESAGEETVNKENNSMTLDRDATSNTDVNGETNLSINTRTRKRVHFGIPLDSVLGKPDDNVQRLASVNKSSIAKKNDTVDKSREKVPKPAKTVHNTSSRKQPRKKSRSRSIPSPDGESKPTKPRKTNPDASMPSNEITVDSSKEYIETKMATSGMKPVRESMETALFDSFTPEKMVKFKKFKPRGPATKLKSKFDQVKKSSNHNIEVSSDDSERTNRKRQSIHKSPKSHCDNPSESDHYSLPSDTEKRVTAVRTKRFNEAHKRDKHDEPFTNQLKSSSAKSGPVFLDGDDPLVALNGRRHVWTRKSAEIRPNPKSLRQPVSSSPSLAENRGASPKDLAPNHPSAPSSPLPTKNRITTSKPAIVVELPTRKHVPSTYSTDVPAASYTRNPGADSVRSERRKIIVTVPTQRAIRGSELQNTSRNTNGHDRLHMPRPASTHRTHGLR